MNPSVFYVIAAALVGLWGVTVYNRLVRLGSRRDEGWSGVSVQLKRRHDLEPGRPRERTAAQRYAGPRGAGKRFAPRNRRRRERPYRRFGTLRRRRRSLSPDQGRPRLQRPHERVEPPRRRPAAGAPLLQRRRARVQCGRTLLPLVAGGGADRVSPRRFLRTGRRRRSPGPESVILTRETWSGRTKTTVVSKRKCKTHGKTQGTAHYFFSARSPTFLEKNFFRTAVGKWRDYLTNRTAFFMKRCPAWADFVTIDRAMADEWQIECEKSMGNIYSEDTVNIQ